MFLDHIRMIKMHKKPLPTLNNEADIRQNGQSGGNAATMDSTKKTLSTSTTTSVQSIQPIRAKGNMPVKPMPISRKMTVPRELKPVEKVDLNVVK